jgi:hypothetical protein
MHEEARKNDGAEDCEADHDQGDRIRVHHL